MLRINRIKVVLAEKRRTNNWLAKEVGASYAMVSRWCTNKAQPRLNMLYRVAKALGVEMHDLLHEMKDIEEE